MSLLQKNFGYVVPQLSSKDIDWVHCNIGFERVGKSSLSFQEAVWIQPDFNVKKQVVFDPQTFTHTVYDLDKGEVLIVDEGSTCFNTKEHATREVIEAVKTLQVCGERNLFIIINLPDFFELVPYLRRHRVMSMCRVISRGHYCFYSRAKINKITKENDIVRYPAPDFDERFGKVVGEKWQEYINHKRRWAKIRGSKAKPNDIISFVTTGEFAEETGYTADHILRLCKKGEIEGFRINNRRMLIPRSELEKFKMSENRVCSDTPRA